MLYKGRLKSWAVFVVPLLIVVGLFVGIVLTSQESPVNEPTSEPSRDSSHEEILASCIEHTSVSLHVHSTLAIMINGSKQEIPARVGIDENGCMHPVHTHDASGTIHVEYLYPVNFTLLDFFMLWGQTFSQSELMGLQVDDAHIITMTVNGESSEAYENLVLRDEDEIVISYEPIP